MVAPGSRAERKGDVEETRHFAMTGERIFWVFGRRGPTDAMEQIGQVKAASEAIAYVYARANYRERAWRDLAVVPRDSFYRPGLDADEPALAERTLR